MQIISSYAAEIKHFHAPLKGIRDTIKIYQDAVSFCIKVCEDNWDTFESLSQNGKYRVDYLRKLIHTTSSNQAEYTEFDEKFKKLPSYLFRELTNATVGYMNSYHSNLKNWKQADKKGKRPRLQTHPNILPTFYKGNTYEDRLDENKARIKLYVDNDWKYVDVDLKKTDVKSIEKHKADGTMKVPSLEKKNKKWFLRFAFEKKVELNNTNVEDQRILSVDLGVNTDATCCVMEADGTILARKFIDFPSEKDRLYHTLNKIKKVQRKYGSNNFQKLWRQATFANDELARKIARAIIETAIEYGCNVIVFEHLDFKGKIRGRKKQKLHLWKKRTIQNIVELNAHKNKIRISRICAWNTSRLAFDGSGRVTRGKDAGFKNNKLCKFANGKTYNCDLSASYNIGARYFIREIQKTLPVRVWSDVTAKVPECQKRTQCTYATLLSMLRVAA